MPDEVIMNAFAIEIVRTSAATDQDDAEPDELDGWLTDSLLVVDGAVIPLSVIHREFLSTLPETDRKYWPWGRIRHRLRDVVSRLEPGSPLVLANACWRRPRLIPGTDDLLVDA